jgi:hypothetical protein
VFLLVVVVVLCNGGVTDAIGVVARFLMNNLRC